ncbi:universal stress protein [Altererythrobacter sp. ZODW24]|uniref:universal stress protein n=1 Tax=Altererythrobacter sp. ZODW24 TaxID=2185142 RepID=UPI000DF7FCA0|nr:universal stress protein [Altererythrobacter sp. ZODW24]
MRSILLHIHEDDCQEARFQTALDLARHFDAHLTCVHAVPYEFGVPGDFYGTMASQLAIEYEKNARTIREKFKKRLAAEDVSWEWIFSNGPASQLIKNYAPLSDVVVLGARNPVGSPDHPSLLVTELIGAVRPPLMVVPANMGPFILETPAVVAWNGSAEASHAIAAALPILKLASEVHILEVEEEEKPRLHKKLPATEAAEFLARHEIEAEIVKFPMDKKASIAAGILNAATIRQAGYLVMGAYGHSRLRERILGGVTRELLKDPKIPLILSH